MSSETQEPVEMETCESCGQEFALDPDKVASWVHAMFCPHCLAVSPYLTEDTEK